MGRFQHISAMNSHAEGFVPLHITARSDQAQLINPEIGAEPGDAADVQRTGRFNQDDDDQSVQLMEVTQQISHGFRCHLEARHRRCFTTHNLVDQVGIADPIADAHQLRCKESLSGQTVTAGAVDSEQLPPVFRITLELQSRLHIRILLGTVDHPQKQDSAG